MRNVRRYRLMALGPPLAVPAVSHSPGVLQGLQYGLLLFVLVFAYAVFVLPKLRERAAKDVRAEHAELGTPPRVTVVDRNRGSGHRPQAGASESRPVMLVTFDVPVRADAAELAVDAAVESGQKLLLVNLVELPIRPMTASWGSETVVLEDVETSLRAPAELAHSLAVAVERLRVVSPRPLAALLELVGERSRASSCSAPTPGACAAGRTGKRRAGSARRRRASSGSPASEAAGPRPVPPRHARCQTPCLTPGTSGTDRVCAPVLPCVVLDATPLVRRQ